MLGLCYCSYCWKTGLALWNVSINHIEISEKLEIFLDVDYGIKMLH